MTEERAQIYMKGHKRNGAKRQILLFLAVLAAVLVIGLLIMEILYLTASPQERQSLAFFQFSTGLLSDTSVQEEITQETDQNALLLEQALEQGQAAKIFSCADEKRVTLLFAGDVLLDDSYAMMSTYQNRGSVITEAFSEVLLDRMQQADIFMLNQEGTLTDRGQPTAGKQFTFRGKPENVGFLLEMGADIAALANNHSYDYGEVSLLDTLDTLESAGIMSVGAGRNLDEAKRPIYLIANGMKIAVVSATQIERTSIPDTKEATQTSAGVLRCMNPDLLLESLAEAKANSDFTILYIHWGTESRETIDWLQEEQALLYAEAGVDLIIGDHPHCLQKIDVVAGVPVVYSLGNFWFNSKTQNTCLIEVVLEEGKLQSMEFIPCLQSDCRTRLLDGEERTQVISYMRRISPNVTIGDDGLIGF